MNKKQLFAAISLLTLSGALGQVNATPSTQLASNPFQRCDALKGSSLDKADCACQLALDNGSAKVIQMFINRYAKEIASTACGAVDTTLTFRGNTHPGGGGNNYN